MSVLLVRVRVRVPQLIKALWDSVQRVLDYGEDVTTTLSAMQVRAVLISNTHGRDRHTARCVHLTFQVCLERTEDLVRAVDSSTPACTTASTYPCSCRLP